MKQQDLLEVSIHAPRVGRDVGKATLQNIGAFQFTRPAWGATETVEDPPAKKGFNSRAPRGARHDVILKLSNKDCFNSRAPRGARPESRWMISARASFNSRAPRGARLVGAVVRWQPGVSIHAPRVGRDGVYALPDDVPKGFNSRAPRGARLTIRYSLLVYARFNSRAPRGARLTSRAC